MLDEDLRAIHKLPLVSFSEDRVERLELASAVVQSRDSEGDDLLEALQRIRLHGTHR